MSSSETNRRIEKIEAIEKEIALALQSAGLAVEELSKVDGVLPVADSQAKNFLRHLQQVETGLAEQIAYLGRVSSSSVCGNTPRLAELKFEHKSASVRDVQHRLELSLAAAGASVAKHGCVASTTGATNDDAQPDDSVTATAAPDGVAADLPMDST